jgi:ABC-2 type transport system permease protein
MKPLVIAGNSMRRFYRDRSAVFFTLVLPVVLILIVGSATSKFGRDVVPVGFADEGSGTLGAQLRRSIDGEPTIELRAYDDAEALAKAVRRGAISAGVVLPRSYDEQIRAGETVEVKLLIDQTRALPGEVRSIVAENIARQGASLQAARFTTRHVGGAFDANLVLARRTAGLLRSVAVDVQSIQVGKADSNTFLAPGIGYQAPSNLILFVFITSLAASGTIIQSRQLKVTHRMLGTPTTARTILAGEALSRFVIAVFQALFIFIVGTLLFGVEWGQPLGAAAVILLFVLVGTSFGMLFGTIFSTPEQSGAVGAPMGIAAGMLGGCMWPLEIVPKPMQAIGHIFPHAWAMDAWIELIGRGGGIGDIGRQLIVLAGFVVVLLPLASWRLRRSILSA